MGLEIKGHEHMYTLVTFLHEWPFVLHIDTDIHSTAVLFLFLRSFSSSFHHCTDNYIKRKFVSMSYSIISIIDLIILNKNHACSYGTLLLVFLVPIPGVSGHVNSGIGDEQAGYVATSCFPCFHVPKNSINVLSNCY